MSPYLFITPLHNLVVGVAPDSQVLSVVFGDQLGDLQEWWVIIQENTYNAWYSTRQLCEKNQTEIFHVVYYITLKSWHI